MSWIKRRGQATTPNPPSVPPVQMYNPNQHSSLQNQWQQQDLQPPANNWYNQTQPNQQKSYSPSSYTQQSQPAGYWQQPFNQPTDHSYNQNTTHQYNQQYSQSQYSHGQAGYYENNSYQPQQNYTTQQSENQGYGYAGVQNHVEQQQQPQSDADSWNWGWGDEDNSNIQKLPSGNSNANTNQPSNTNQPANAVTNSFANDESWNWTVEEANTNSGTDISNKNNSELHKTSSTSSDGFVHQNMQNVDHQDNMFPKMGKLAEKHSRSPDMFSQNYKDNGVDHKANPENLPVNQLLVAVSPKHNKSDNLTPQWSTESQLSQDSSDLLHTSESDKSHMLSRSSTISESPVSGHDTNPDAFVPRQDLQRNQQFENSFGTASAPEAPPKIESNTSVYYRQDNYNSQQENREVLSSLKEDSRSFKSNPTPPPPLKNQTPPLMPPPTSGDDSRNPYKRSAGLSHKAANKYRTENRQQQGFYMPSQTYPVSSSPFNQSVNLETLPDNSEQPDSPPQQAQPRKLSSSKTPVQQWPENNEIAPINDRNQYLETGQLSNNDFRGNHTESSDSLPPPGFTRMVLGQMEQADNSLGNQDEPPPGLSRMVLGQGSSSAAARGELNELLGLHRMVPGESSSPETTLRPSAHMQMSGYGDGDVSESELNQPVRSATIGADTPPVAANLPPPTPNRSETIGADIPLPYTSTSPDNKNARSASSSYNSNIRETNADGANNLDETVANPPASNRRDSIEGEPHDSAISTLVNSVRDLTVGENPTDGANSTTSLPERTARRLSRQESTDSEHEHESRGKAHKDRKDRRYHDKHDQYEREKGRSRYSPSPDQYRDRKHERRKYRDKRYDDDTDCYSDKERNLRREERDKREEYDRKYSSLKRDKEKDRTRRDYRSHRDRDSGRRNDYYRRYEDEYDDTRGSRPSSRSDSMHDAFRQERPRDRDRGRHRRHQDPFNPYMQQGYSYDPYHPYYQQYQYHYYENLRRTNPQAYAEWYRKYYQQQSGAQQGYGNEDRASVHSGRSSANDELAKDRYTRQSYYSQASLNYYREPHTHSHSISGHYGLDETRPFDQTDSSLYLEETTVASQRLTPAKFATAHIKASISSGHLVKIFPHYPLDGQTAFVEVSNLHDLLGNDDEYKDLLEFPGPLVKGVSHKKTIIEYCESKIRSAICSRDIADVESYILMWELLILLLRQNGMVVGTDIAELLMKDRKPQPSRRGSVVSNSSSAAAEGATVSEASNLPVSETHSSSTSILKEEVVTNKFRDYLIYGSGKEALEWAMKHGLWGHALFLASKLDKRTYANVMTRFANGLTMNDPLQTLYQLLSGKVPASVTCVADEKWGDWRPHLAMILSNTTQRPELDRKAITTLGDTLFSRGSLYAAQFCYLMAQVGFSRYGADGGKLVLLGSNHNKPFLEFANNEAIQMTEVYEYACSLNDAAFIIPEFLPYKYLLATRLADRGLLEKALAYLEKITLAVLQNPSLAQQSLVSQVCQLADRLKYCDPVEEPFEEGDGEFDSSRPDHSWLKDLKAIERDYNMGLITHESVDNFAADIPESDPSQTVQAVYEQQTTQESWQQQYIDPQQYQQQQQWQTPQYTEQQPQLEYQQHVQSQPSDVYRTEQFQEQQQYWPNQPQWGDSGAVDTSVTNHQQDNSEQQLQNDYWNNAHTQQEEVEKQPDEDALRPQITMPNQPKGPSTFDNAQEDSNQPQAQKKESPAKHKPSPDKPAATGWFGGIWNKLSLRPKNQMKLPDDKNPTIVWDEQKKRWINLEADGDGGTVELKPPPKMTDMFPTKQQPPAPSMPPQAEIPYQNNNVPLAKEPMQMGMGQGDSLMMPNHNSHNPSMIPIQVTQRAPQPAAATHDEPAAQPKPSQPNMFKLQRNRNIKKSYVDVFNPGAKPAGASHLPAPDSFSSLPSNGPQMNFFIPAPVTDPNAPTDFLTPAPVHNLDDAQQQMHQQQ